VSIGQIPNAAKFRCAVTNCVPDIRCQNIFAAEKVDQSSP